MFEAILGHSMDIDSGDAIAEILTQCSAQLADRHPQAGILLAAVDLDYQLILDQIQAAYPGLQLIGCTTDGELSSIHGFQEDSMTLMLFCSDTVSIRAGLGHGLSTDPSEAAQQAINSLDLEDGEIEAIRLCIALPDGLADGVEVALRQMQKQLSIGTPIVGGRAGDQYRFEKTYQFYQGQVLHNALPILIFCGDLKVSQGVASGWQPLSREARVTKAEGYIVYEIDHQPATKFYQEYTGSQPVLGEYPLAVFENANEDFYLRAAFHEDSSNNSIHFMGEVPEQANVTISYATNDQIITATKTSMEQAAIHYPGKQPAAVLLISCAARRWILGNRAQEEYATSQQFLDPTIPVIGFYSYGEISPLQQHGPCRYHQETLVTVFLGTE